MEIKIPEDAKIQDSRYYDDVPNITEIETNAKAYKEKQKPSFVGGNVEQLQEHVKSGTNKAAEEITDFVEYNLPALGGAGAEIGAAVRGLGLATRAVKTARTARTANPFAKGTDDLVDFGKRIYDASYKKIENLFKKSPNDIPKQPSKSFSERLGDIFRPNKTTQQTSKEKTSLEKFDDFFKSSNAKTPKNAPPPRGTKNPDNISKSTSPFSKLFKVGGAGLVGAGLYNLMSDALGGGGNSQYGNMNGNGIGGGILSPIQNFASAALTSMPSGGDSGMVGESHFGGGSLNGLTIMQALSKIYSLLVESNDALRKISDNTSRALQQSAKADTGADIASANAKARENETGQGYSAIYENNRQLNNDEVISENGESRPRETGKSGLATKLVNALKTGVDWTVKSAALGLGMGAIAASDAQANIGGGDLFSMGDSEEYSGLYSDSQYDRIKSIVRQAESKNNYSAVYQTPAGKPEKQLTDMTIREIIEFQDKMLRSAPSGTKPHSPVGAYQIVRDTLKANYELAGLTLDDKFTTENQDKIADVLISKRKYRSDGSIEDFARELGGEWEVLKSMPNKPSKVPYSVIMDAIVGVEKDQTDEKTQPQMQESNLEYIKPPTSEKFTKLPQGFSVIDDIDQAIKNNNENNLSSATGINTSKVQKDTTQHIDELEQLSSGKYSSSNKVIPQSVLYQQREMVFDSKPGKLVAKTNTPAVTPIIDEPTTHENLKESTLGAQSIVTEKPQDHAAMQGMNDNLSKVAQLVAANQQTQPVPQIIRTPPPDPAGTGGGIMSVRNEDPVLLTLTFQNVRTA